MTEKTKQEVVQEIAALVASSQATIREAEVLADKHGVEFYYDGPQYGMGGYYNPRTLDELGNPVLNRWGGSPEGEGWMASSHSC